MFWSKIWFFLVAVVAGVLLTVALVMPRPADRAAQAAESKRLRRACGVANILLRDNARARIQLASEFAQAVRSLKLSTTLYQASKGDIISGEANATGRSELNKLLEDVSGTKPSFVILIDQKGRVVARAGLDDKSYGNSIRGYFLVDDVLDGYLRDDLWIEDGKLYRIAGAPVLTQQLEWAGGIILGQAIDNDFVTTLSENLTAEIGFFVGQEAVATSDSTPIQDEIAEHAAKLRDAEFAPPSDCGESEVLSTSSGGNNYAAVTARLPGEAGAMGAYYSIYVEKEAATGFMATLKAVKSNDLSFGKFPWIPVVIAFLVIIGVGLFLMIMEGDQPLRRLNSDALALAQGERERLVESLHRGKFGGIARSVNIAIDKLHRDAKTAKKDLDQLLGPAPAEGGSGADIASSLPALAPTGPSAGPAQPPPPSAFQFSDDLGIGAPPPAKKSPPPKPAIPTPDKARVKPPIPGAAAPGQVPPKPVSLPDTVEKKLTPPAPQLDAIDADILGSQSGNGAGSPDAAVHDEVTTAGGPTRVFDGARSASEPEHATGDSDDAYLREIFDNFVSLKQECGESIENLTFDRFATKLRSNRDALIAKHGCKSVKFQVYVKDGKAALKASPVR